MSELIQKNDGHAIIRWRLLTGVSALALTTYVSTMSIALAEEGNRPQIWIELGGQFSQNQNGQQVFLSPFVPAVQPPFESPVAVEKLSPTSMDGNGKITFEPTGSDWIFSAAVAFGKNSRNKYLGELTQNTNGHPFVGVFAAYQNITSKSTTSHTILDFSVGRDVGLGVGVSSSVNLGVRFAQFSAKRDTLIHSQPTNGGFSSSPYHKIAAHLVADGKFSGVGPSISWDASAAVAGNRDDGEIAIDWGINGAVLFGRQSVRGHHQTTNAFYIYSYAQSYYKHSASLNRSKQLAVPNVGGFAGISWRYPNAKISFGYRADFFFGAMDGGIDARVTKDIGFYGPFASVSIGLGG